MALRAVTLLAFLPPLVTLAPGRAQEHPRYGATAVSQPLLPSTNREDATASGTELEVAERPGALETVSDALREAPGAHPQALGGFGSFSGVSLRGAELGHTSVLIGELPLSSGDDGAFDLSLLPLGLFERVEVYRGGAPAWLGEGSIGGVVRLLPKRGAERSAGASTGAGSFGRLHGSAHSELGPDSPDGPALFTHVALDHADNDFPYLDPGRPLIRGDEVERDTQNAQHTQGSALLLANAPLLGGELELLALGLGRTGGIPGPQGAPSLHAHRQLVRSHGALGYSRRGTLSGARTYRAQLVVGGDYEANRVSDRGEIGTTFFAETDDRRLQALARAAGTLALVSGLELTALGSLRYENLQPENPLARRVPPRPSQRMSEVGVVELRAFGAVLELPSELRGSARLLFTQAELRGGRTEPLETVEVDTLAPTYRLGAAIAPFPFLGLSASVATGQRLPAFGELFGDRAFLQANPALEPERSVGGDVGLTLMASSGAFCVASELRAFRLRIEDSIVYVRSARFDARPENLGYVVLQGLELGKRLSYGELIAWSTTATALESETSLGHQAPHRPNLVLYTRPEVIVRPGFGRLLLFADLQVVTFNYTDKANLHAIPGRQQVGAGAALGLWGERVELTARASNLLDQASEDLNGFALPRRALFASLTIEEDL